MLALTSGVKLKKRTYSVAGPFSPVHAEHTCSHSEAQAQINSLRKAFGPATLMTALTTRVLQSVCP